MLRFCIDFILMFLLFALDRIFDILRLMLTSLLFFVPLLFVHALFLTLKRLLPSLVHKFTHMRILVESLRGRDERIMINLLHFLLDDP